MFFDAIAFLLLLPPHTSIGSSKIQAKKLHLAFFFLFVRHQMTTGTITIITHTYLQIVGWMVRDYIITSIYRWTVKMHNALANRIMYAEYSSCYSARGGNDLVGYNNNRQTAESFLFDDGERRWISIIIAVENARRKPTHGSLFCIFLFSFGHIWCFFFRN